MDCAGPRPPEPRQNEHLAFIASLGADLDKVHGAGHFVFVLQHRVSNECPEPQASLPSAEGGWDGWAHLLTSHKHTHTPHCWSPVSQASSKILTKTPPQTFHCTAAQQDKTHSEIKTFTFNPKDILLLVFFWHFKLLYDVQAIFWCHIIHLHRNKCGGTVSLNVTRMWKSNLEETDRSER